MKIRVIPLIEIEDTCVSEFVEGASGKVYGHTKQHPEARRCSQVFPHPALEKEEVIQAWLTHWPRARFDIFALVRRCASIGVDYLVQVQRDGVWITQPRQDVYEITTPAPGPGPQQDALKKTVKRSRPTAKTARKTPTPVATV